MPWHQFQRAIFLIRSRLALPYMSLFQNLILATAPSTAPDEYGQDGGVIAFEPVGEGVQVRQVVGGAHCVNVTVMIHP